MLVSQFTTVLTNHWSENKQTGWRLFMLQASHFEPRMSLLSDGLIAITTMLLLPTPSGHQRLGQFFHRASP